MQQAISGTSVGAYVMIEPPLRKMLKQRKITVSSVVLRMTKMICI